MTEIRRNRRRRSHGGAIAVMGTLILLILLSTIILFLPEKETKKKQTEVTPTGVPTGTVTNVPEERSLLAVVLDVDTEVKMITVYDVTAEEEKRLVYTGASTFFDGYGIQLTAAQLVKGGLYRFNVNTKEEWITTGEEAVDRREKPKNTDVWEKTGVDYMVITPEMISFRDQNYRYSDKVCVMNNGKRMALDSLQPTVDIVTVRGVGQVIYEIVVTKGHGYITLKNHEDFIGGTIAIGSTRVDSVSQEAKYLVREGVYPVIVEHGNYTGKETITVSRDATSVFDVFQYGRGPIKKGWLTINIDPLGATLYIDGVETPYTDGVELEYGTYKFEFSEGGYVSYKATVLINQPKQSLSVYLIEQKAEENPATEQPDVFDTTKNPWDDVENAGDFSENTSGGSSKKQTSVSVKGMGYEIDEGHAIYILEPVGAEILLDGESIGYAPINFENIMGSCIITVIRKDGSVKNFNHFGETQDFYYKFNWID